MKTKCILGAFLIVCAGCASLSTQRHRPADPQTTEKSGARFVDFDWGARAALKSIGIEREPSAVKYHPMGIDRLTVEVPSLNPDVPHLTVVFWKPDGRNWSLSGPSQEEVDNWLNRSKPK